MRRLREKKASHKLTTEEMELKRIKKLQKEAKKKSQISASSCQQALKATSYAPVRAVVAPTKPQGFHFETDERIKDTKASLHTKTKSFETQLRGHAPSPSKGKPRATKPKPFNLHTSKRSVDKPVPLKDEQNFEKQLRAHPPSPSKTRTGVTKPLPFKLTEKADEPSAVPPKKWQSMASMASNFQTKTPTRFRTRAAQNANNFEGDTESSKQPRQLTTAKTPNLSTKTRSRPVTAPSKDDLEEKQVEEMKNYQFKATAFNPKILEKGGMYGVKNKSEKPTTVQEPFHFKTDSRVKPLELESEKQKPSASAPGEKMEKPKNTKVVPFSFDTRDQERIARKEEKIKAVIEEEKKLAEFRASKLPTNSPDALPSVPTKPITKPAPFQLSQGEAYHEKWEKQRKAEEEEAERQRKFKAQEAEVIKKEPFKPKTGLIPPTDITEVILNTDVRAKERATFDQFVADQEREKEMTRAAMEQRKREEEEEEIRQMRENATVQAQPIRHYKPVEVMPSSEPLTEPKTPAFATNKRLGRI